MKKIWFILCMSAVLSFGLSSCLDLTEEQQSEINSLIDIQIDLKTKLALAIAKHKTGDLSTADLMGLKDEISENIQSTKDEVQKLRDSGMSIWDLAVATGIGVISRGIPSKGPLAKLFAVFTARRKEDDD